MVTYEELGKMKVIGPRPIQIKELLQERPMSADEIAKTLGISVAATRPYLRDLVKKDEDVGKTRIGRNVYYYLRSVLERHKE